MPLDNYEELLPYYERELTYLRKMGSAFASRYPKIASRLELGMDHCPDPNVERLIESFAFLTGRLQHNIDSQFPEISSALLGILYPHFLNPVPSMSIAQFAADPDQMNLTGGFNIKKNTPLSTQNEQGQTVRFKTCYPVTLWPVRVTYAGFESTDQFDFLDQTSNVVTVLRLRLQTTAENFAEAGLTDLRFYLHGEGALPLILYELLFCNLIDVVLLPDKKSPPVYLPKDAVQPVGFGTDEDVLPYHKFSHPGYRLLQEYFTFEDKFLFFDLKHLNRHGSDKSFDVLILLDQRPRNNLVLDEDTFSLGCTPIINLFSKTSEPIRWDHRQTEYQLIPDIRRERTTEIHSVLKVSGTSDPSDETQVYQPFYSFTHEMEQGDHQAFWHARRDHTGKKNFPGTDMFLTFLDLQFKPTQPPKEAIYAHTLCTNRDLAEQLPERAILKPEEAAPVTNITTLTKPTRQLMPPLSGAAQWRLISHLSLNFLSLNNEKAGLKAFHEILGLYGFAKRRSTTQQILGIREMESRKVVRRIGQSAWKGFSRGVEVTLTFDESVYGGNSAFLLASVLNHFLPLYASLNTFTQLVIKSHQREGIWKQWPPMVGEQIIL